MQTGEDTQGLRKIVDLTRLISIFILAVHFYICCYQAFVKWHWTATITDRIVANIAKTGLFTNMFIPKLAGLICLAISLVGVKGKKDEKINWRNITAYLISGLLILLDQCIMLLPAYGYSHYRHMLYGFNRYRLFADYNWRHLFITPAQRKTEQRYFQIPTTKHSRRKKDCSKTNIQLTYLPNTI